MSKIQFREAWVQVHLWLGLTLGAIGVLLGVTGSVLVFDHEVDALLNPQRYAVSGAKVALPHGDYLKIAAEVTGGRGRPVLARFPVADGMPVTVFLRPRNGAASDVLRVYLDPANGRALDVASGRGFVLTLHVLHENLMLREFWGREVVGAVGFGMLISALSGLYLWWPLGGRWRGAFGFRKGFTLLRNLHYTGGFYLSLVLATLSLSGIFLAFPDGGRATVAAFAPVTPSVRGVQAASRSDDRPIAPGEAIAIAQKLYPEATIAALGMPAGARGAYRVALREPGDRSERGNTLVFVDPRTQEVLRRVDVASRTGGDAFLAWQRYLHSGEEMNLAWRILICIAGLLPALLLASGITMWLKRPAGGHL